MTVRKSPVGRFAQSGKLNPCIFDVDGVLLASPHERAWREALQGFADPDRFTPRIFPYHSDVSIPLELAKIKWQK